ncbi:hypothetical protein DSM100685_1838 [Bifidobacterium avesanii]|nr:hypothetical protein DSM100685_1838 [Bifidobacterium avesanii]
MEVDGDGWDDDYAAGEDIIPAFDGVNDVLDNALATRDYAAAMRNAVAVMLIADKALEYLGSSESADDCIERLERKVLVLMEKAARDADAKPSDLSSMADALTEATSSRTQQSEVVDNMIAGLLSFSAHLHTRSIADAALSRLERDADANHSADLREWRSYLHALRHDDLALAGECNRVQRYELAHLEDGTMAKFAVTRAMLVGDYGRARELVERHMRLAAKDPAAGWGFEALPVSTFPYGWTTVLIAIAQHSGDRDELERLYTEIIVHGEVRIPWLEDDALQNDKQCVDRLRALSGGRRWRDRVLPGIVAACRWRAGENRAYEYLLLSEHMAGQALEYCAKVPGTIDRLYGMIATAHPREATELLLKPYEGDRAFVGAVPRAEYRNAADRLRRARSFMGSAWVAEYARSLVARYPRRTNLRVALKGLI